MNVATILLVGPTLPYHVIDYAISWAKENEGSLHTLYIVPSNVPSEDYPFPNDLDEAEELTTEVDAERGVRRILQRETRFIEKRAHASHIPIHTEILFSPSIEQVLARINQSEIIFIDKDAEQDTDAMKDFEFDLDQVRDKTSRYLFAVGEHDRYSDVFY